MAEKIECKNHEWIPLLGINKGKGVVTSLFTCLKCGDLKVGEQTIKISQYRLDMGELPINNVLGIKLVESPTANQTASGLIVSMTYGESITLGDLLYFKSDEKVYKADANGASTYPVAGLALATASSGSNNVLLHGIYRDSVKWTGGSVLTVGAFVICQLQWEE
ncbi:MAG: DUF2190 family protein [Parcubacteria group bacterium]|nr:DUF2190 family protein [Parcubacteria group bacterium]